MSEHVPEPVEKNIVKPRNPWLAGGLSLVITGLGQVYNGQWKKGAGFMAAELVLALSMISLFGNFTSLALLVAFLLGFSLFVAREAYATAKGLRDFMPCRANRWWIYVVFLAGGLLAGAAFEDVVQSRFYRAYKAPSGSMIPTLMVGDHFMVEILGTGDSLERGDIVVFRVPGSGEKDFVKRVIALPGETVEVRDKAVFVDGRELDEPYVLHSREDTVPQRDGFGPVTLPEDGYFVMGDNREASYDSRMFGPVRRERITGRALYIYFPGWAGSGKWSERLGTALK